MTMHRALHPRANVSRLYVPRKEGGKGMMSIEDCVNLESRALGQYLKNNEDEWLKSAWQDQIVKVDEDPEIYRYRTAKEKKRKLA